MSKDELIAASVQRLAKAIEEFPSEWYRMVHGERPLSSEDEAKAKSRQLFDDSFTK